MHGVIELNERFMVGGLGGVAVIPLHEGVNLFRVGNLLKTSQI